ncbi:MAG: FAD-dependent oxidoreductase [Acidobacteria bacterium]|nr:FAD-dependent oxidoreductase [Acidobacteriota bacterium]
MAKTPLFRLLQRSLQNALRSSAAESDKTVLSDALSRRRFLVTSGAATAGLALSHCGPGQSPAPVTAPAVRATTEDAIVVGGGLAGLTAAYRLKQAGVTAGVYEAQERVGGRVRSLRGHFPDGQVAELGGELIDTPHKRVRGLASELGLEVEDLLDDHPDLSKAILFFEDKRLDPSTLEKAFAPFGSKIRADLDSLGKNPDPTYKNPGNAQTLDRMSLSQWFDRSGFEGWLRQLLDVAYVTEYGLEASEQSALNFLLMIDPALGKDMKFFGESDERFHIKGGNDQIPRKLSEKLPGQIEFGARLESIQSSPSGGYVLSFRRGTASFEKRTGFVVLTLPFSVLNSVEIKLDLPERKRRAFLELGYGTNGKLMLSYGSRIWRGKHKSNGSVMTDLPSQMFWETSRRQAGAAGIITNFCGGRRGVTLGQGTPEQQALIAAGDFERIFPGSAGTHSAEKAVRFHWPLNEFSLGSYACYRPGQWTEFRGVEGEPAGRLFFAGEHTSLTAQGYMEGAVESGERAAKEILTAMGKAR